MKENILKLREGGKSYREIEKILGCSRSTISYHCGKGQKQKNLDRGRNNLKRKFHQQVSNFKSKGGRTKATDFQRNRKNGLYSGGRDYNFNTEDLVRVLSKTKCCYLSGRPINTEDSGSFHLDHIIPSSRGGENTLSNLGIASKEANKAKDNLTVDEFIELCKDVLEYNGYKVTKNRK